MALGNQFLDPFLLGFPHTGLPVLILAVPELIQLGDLLIGCHNHPGLLFHPGFGWLLYTSDAADEL